MFKISITRDAIAMSENDIPEKEQDQVPIDGTKTARFRHLDSFSPLFQTTKHRREVHHETDKRN